jgi:uncharacterized membrane protein YraQ (UPF0718 family)
VHNASRSEGRPLRENVRSAEAWSDVAHNFRGDVQMLWKEILTGFVLAAAVSLLPDTVFDHLLLTGHEGTWVTLENALVGPVVAALSFVCSVGNVPLAAVLWSHGMAFAGVVSFVFADLLVVPIVRIYARYYGWGFTARIVALMYATMVLAALAIDVAFDGAGLVPVRSHHEDAMFGAVGLDYKLALNVVGLVIFAALWRLTARRGAVDPVCGMTVDRAKARAKGLVLEHDGREVFFCAAGCKASYAREHGLVVASPRTSSMRSFAQLDDADG